MYTVILSFSQQAKALEFVDATYLICIIILLLRTTCDQILITMSNDAGPNDHTIAQIKDAVRDGLRSVKNTMEDESVVLVSPPLKPPCRNICETWSVMSPDDSKLPHPYSYLRLLQCGFFY